MTCYIKNHIANLFDSKKGPSISVEYNFIKFLLFHNPFNLIIKLLSNNSFNGQCRTLYNILKPYLKNCEAN